MLHISGNDRCRVNLLTQLNILLTKQIGNSIKFLSDELNSITSCMV